MHFHSTTIGSGGIDFSRVCNILLIAMPGLFCDGLVWPLNVGQRML
jgi:hypothetical protein